MRVIALRSVRSAGPSSLVYPIYQTSSPLWLQQSGCGKAAPAVVRLELEKLASSNFDQTIGQHPKERVYLVVDGGVGMRPSLLPQPQYIIASTT